MPMSSSKPFNDNYSGLSEMRGHYNYLIDKHNLTKNVPLIPMPDTVNGIRGVSGDFRHIDNAKDKLKETREPLKRFKFSDDKKDNVNVKVRVYSDAKKKINDKTEGLIFSVPRKTVLMHEVGHLNNRDSLREKVKSKSFKLNESLRESDSKLKSKVLSPHAKYLYHLLGEIEEKSANKFVKKELRDMGYSKNQIRAIELGSKMYRTPYHHMRNRKSAYDDYFKNIFKKEEKTAFNIIEEAFEKTARSYDAKRKKQYKQMLKRLYGGNDTMIDNLRRTKDIGIYHGTKDMDSVMQNGLRPSSGKDGSIAVFGKGVYFGDNNMAEGYNGNGLVRLKTPSELKRTDILYPKTTKAMKADIKVNPRLADEKVNKYKTYGGKEVYKRNYKVNNKNIKDIHPAMLSTEMKLDIANDTGYLRKNLDKVEYSKNTKNDLKHLYSQNFPSKRQTKLKKHTLLESLKPHVSEAPDNNQFIYRGGVDKNLLTDANKNPLKTNFSEPKLKSKTPTLDAINKKKNAFSQIKNKNKTTEQVINKVKDVVDTTPKVTSKSMPKNSNAVASLLKNKKLAVGAGIGAGIGAGLYGLSKLKNKDKNNEKVASQIVMESFEKFSIAL